MCAKLYYYRDTMRRFWGEKYPAKIEEFRGFIEKERMRSGLETLHATMGLVQILQEEHPDSSLTQALLFAACVEMIEPKKETRAAEILAELGT